MAYVAPPFTPTVTISGTDLIRNTDEKLQTIANDVGDYLEAQSQAMYTDLDGQMTVIENDYNTVLKPEIEQKMDDLLGVNPDGTYYTKSAIDALVASKVAKVTSTDNAIARFDGTTGEVQGSGVVVDDSGNVGIGTSSPGQALHIVKTGDARIRLYDNTTQYWDLNASASNFFSINRGTSEYLKISSSGNLGIGVTPSAWLSTYKALSVGYSSLANLTGDAATYLTSNSYYDGNWKYISTNTATAFISNAGAYEFRVAPSGTAGGTVTWTTALTIPNTGGIKLPNTAIANATTLDWYEEATATLTATGMTTSPTGTGRFTRSGDTVTGLIPTFSGTSNATTFTVTGIPTNFRPSFYRYVLVRTQDNSGSLVVSNATVDSTGVLTMYKDAGTTAFTASGVKSVQTIQIQYHI